MHDVIFRHDAFNTTMHKTDTFIHLTICTVTRLFFSKDIIRRHLLRKMIYNLLKSCKITWYVYIYVDIGTRRINYV